MNESPGGRWFLSLGELVEGPLAWPDVEERVRKAGAVRGRRPAIPAPL